MDKQYLKVILVIIIFTLVLGTFIHYDLKAKKGEKEMLLETINKKTEELHRVNIELEAVMDNNLDLEMENSHYKEKIEELKKEREELRDKVKSQPSRGVSNRMASLGTFEATAYTDNVKSQGKWVGQTASGMKPQVGVIAVDPKIIPLGTKLYVEGYGECVAGDTGGAIKGRIIDVFLPDNDSCTKWGRKKVKVWKIN